MRKIHLALALCVSGALCAMAQPVPLPTPQFAPPSLTPKGVTGLAMSCAICHGPEGRPAPGSAVPPLAGRRERDIVQAMREFKEGTRQATVMHQIARGYSDAEIEALARRFARGGAR
ncbi:MAG TPA: c-type cytochrome [Usitatibacter sp.]|jgi:cytochrome c553|nr:c-type cytochrome [Usitatibacter sp.]